MNKNLSVVIGNRIRKVRETLGLSQKDFVDPLDVTGPFLSQIENGKKTNPGISVFMNISAVYHVSMDYIFHGTGQMFFNDENESKNNYREYIEDIETVEDLLWLFEHSKFFKDSIMGYAGKFKYENDVIIKKSIKR
jgi:transcriptional regulator with XRE-family HTH domain